MDFYFDNDQALMLGSPAKKFDNNLQAIRLAKEITSLIQVNLSCLTESFAL